MNELLCDTWCTYGSFFLPCAMSRFLLHCATSITACVNFGSLHGLLSVSAQIFLPVAGPKANPVVAHFFTWKKILLPPKLLDESGFLPQIIKPSI
jgi:hypothetical protein